MMHSHKRWIGIVLALIVAVAALSFWKLQWYKHQEVEVIVVVKSADPNIEFWQVLIDGLNNAANEFDARVQVWGAESEADVAGQNVLVDRAIQERPDVIVLAATDYQRMVPAAQKVRENGIKLLIVDSGIDSDIPVSSIATDNVKAGIAAGQAMLRQISGPAKIAVVSYVMNAGSLMDREKGVRSVLEKASGDIELLGTFDAAGSSETAYRMMKELLEKDPGVSGIVGLNEPTSVGAGRAIRELGLGDKVKLIGFDSSVDEIRLLEEGTMQATVIQRPFQMGYLSIKTAVEAAKGKNVPKQLDIDSLVITKQNMYEEENQKLLFPFVGR